MSQEWLEEALGTMPIKPYLPKIMAAIELLAADAAREGSTLEGIQIHRGSIPQQEWIVLADLRRGSMIGKTAQWIPR